MDHEGEDHPWCIHGADPNGNLVPNSYCQCGKNYASTYSVAKLSTKPYNPCPYTKPPGPTIHPTNKPNPPWCLHGASPNGDLVPNEYCQCGVNYASTYSVAKSTTHPYNPCPYTKAPGPTVHFHPKGKPASTKPAGPVKTAYASCEGEANLNSLPMNRDVAILYGLTFCEHHKNEVILQHGTIRDHRPNPGKDGYVYIAASVNLKCSKADYSKQRVVYEECMDAMRKSIDECKISSGLPVYSTTC